MKKILVAVDETEASRRAADFVDGFFDREHYSVSAVNVARQPVGWLPDTPYGDTTQWPYPGDRGRLADDALAREEATGQAVASRQAPPGSDIDVLFGETVDAIVVAADDVRADLIVVGSNDKNFLQRLLGGSISEDVVRRASRPVLVVH